MWRQSRAISVETGQIACFRKYSLVSVDCILNELLLLSEEKKVLTEW